MVGIMLVRRSFAALAAVVVVLCALGPAAAETIPRDFRLTAEYYPALLTLAADGRPARAWHRWTPTGTAGRRAPSLWGYLFRFIPFSLAAGPCTMPLGLPGLIAKVAEGSPGIPEKRACAARYKSVSLV